MPRFSASVFEAPAARRSSGSPRRWKRGAFPPSPYTRNDSRGSARRQRCPWGCRACVRRIRRTRSSISRPPTCVRTSTAATRSRGALSCRRYSTASRPRSRMRISRGCRSSGRHRGWLRPIPRTTFSGCSIENHWTDMPADRAADGGARRGDAQRDEPSAGQDRRTAPPDGVPRVLGIHRGESGGQRGDGGCAARVLPGHPRVGRQWNHRAIQQHDLIRDDYGHQRSHPQ